MLNIFIDVAELVFTWQLCRSLENVDLLGWPTASSLLSA